MSFRHVTTIQMCLMVFIISSNDNFYAQLSGFVDFNKFPQATRYTPLPSDWYVALADVQGSTKAIQDGKYQEVNALGVAAIVAVLNSLKPLNIPYVFGGNGATFCIPSSKKTAVASALVATKKMADKSFGLNLRIGKVPVQLIRDHGHEIKIGKFQPSRYYQQAMFTGSGLRYAEVLVKNNDSENPYLINEDHNNSHGNFKGFHCRWDEIPGPHEEIISLLVQVLEQKPAYSNAIFKALLEKIIEIYGNEDYHHPLRQDKLSLASFSNRLTTELRVHTAFQPVWLRWQYALKLKLEVAFGKWLIQNKVKTLHVDWGQYKQTLIANTDYRKFDELLRMVISGTAEKQKDLRNVLEEYRQRGELVYGIHSSPTAIITCIISNFENDHVHFLDGSNGGYALAATEMKQQLQ